MKRLLGIAVIILVVSLVLGYRAFKKELKNNLALNTKVAVCYDKIDQAKKSISGGFLNLKNKQEKVIKSVKSAIQKTAYRWEFKEGQKPVEGVTLYLKHGSTISGKLLSETKDAYNVEWDGQEFVVSKAQVKKIEYKTQKEAEWPYKNDVVVKKTNGIVVDGEIIRVTDGAVSVLFKEGGGSAEMEIERKDIEELIFAPVCNKKSETIEKRLKEQFPKMEFYREGNVTIVTDSYIRSVNEYKRAIRDVNTQVYLKFSRLFKGKKQRAQNYVVIFDDFMDYAEYALTDGVPFWAVVGYFSPLSDTLYLFNAFGERFEKIVFDVIVGKTGKTIDEIAGEIKEKVDERYHLSIDGQLQKIKDKYRTVYGFYRFELTEMTLATLRHEFTHELFHNWGLQNIILSKPIIDKNKLIEKKKEFLETDDYKKKEELLMELMQLRREETEDIEMETAQSWLAEGMATYCETDPVGSKNEEWLYAYQEAVRKNETSPIEFLMVFRMGSFPGLAHKGILNAYAQSWAFTAFLMDRYPEEFISFQKKMAETRPKDDDEELAWLLEAVNKDLPTLEKEFREYMDTYEKVDDPYVRQVTRWREIWDNLY